MNPRFVLIELLVHFLTVLGGSGIDLHHSCRLPRCNLFGIEDGLRFPLSQVARGPFYCTHLDVYVQMMSL